LPPFAGRDFHWKWHEGVAEKEFRPMQVIGKEPAALLGSRVGAIDQLGVDSNARRGSEEA